VRLEFDVELKDETHIIKILQQSLSRNSWTMTMVKTSEDDDVVNFDLRLSCTPYPRESAAVTVPKKQAGALMKFMIYESKHKVLEEEAESGQQQQRDD